LAFFNRVKFNEEFVSNMHKIINSYPKLT